MITWLIDKKEIYMRNEFLKLHLIEHLDFDPIPELDIQAGRFVKNAKDAGCPGQFSVRKRMITAIAETKFKTIDGAPVSLIGLHGKDDMLVAGPAYAIERLASGEELPELNSAAENKSIKAAQELAKSEISYLNSLEEVMSLAGVADRKDKVCKEVMHFFRTNIEEINDFFDGHELPNFVDCYIKEAQEHLEYLNNIYNGEIKYPRWWSVWEDFEITAAGRHITAYPISPNESIKTRRKPFDFMFFGKPN